MKKLIILLFSIFISINSYGGIFNETICFETDGQNIVFFQRLLSDDYIYGWAPIVILILILSGFQMLMLGVIGEYIWRTLSQTRNRPKYVIDEIFEEE